MQMDFYLLKTTMRLNANGLSEDILLFRPLPR